MHTPFQIPKISGDRGMEEIEVWRRSSSSTSKSAAGRIGEAKILDRGGVEEGARKRNGIAGTPVRRSITGPWVQEGGKKDLCPP